ncbi:MAG: YibE/F family protein [Erysipelotrichaceae bacterium]|nr:YibE/F family protein [Erysipelotrichaceae bacterium]
MRKKIKENKATLIVLATCLLLFLLCALWANNSNRKDDAGPSDFAEYENGKVLEVLSDNTFQDEVADGGYRGEQMLTVEVTTGRYKGETLLVYNYVGPIYGIPVKAGDGVTIIISTYADGSHQASVYELNRLPGIAVLILLFVLTAVLIGGNKGAKSLFGLLFIVMTLFFILLPSLMKGAPTIPMTFIVCVFVTAFSLTVMSGVNRKTICAFLGTVSGVFAALLFAQIAQGILRIDGLRMEDVEALLQLRNSGMKIGLRGLLTAGIIVSSLGAVMDAAMGLASAISEVHDADPELGLKQLFLSGMNIGKDMVGTMTSTLVLAFLGSSFVLILYLYSLNLGKYQLLNSAYVSTEVISSLASSIGAILSIPITALISARVFSMENIHKGEK